jgi:hypothetical protein
MLFSIYGPIVDTGFRFQGQKNRKIAKTAGSRGRLLVWKVLLKMKDYPWILCAFSVK